MMSLRPILKVRNKIREKGKSKNYEVEEDATPKKAEENEEDSFVEELKREGQTLE